MKAIFLCGFMGCGKSTVGELVARQLKLPLIDTDAYLVEQEGRSIPEIFAQDGEPYFRKIEAEAIRTLCGTQAVIACGGGAMLNPDSAAAARKEGVVVLLDESFDTCYRRIKGDTNRPIVQRSTKEELEQLFKACGSVPCQCLLRGCRRRVPQEDGGACHRCGTGSLELVFIGNICGFSSKFFCRQGKNLQAYFRMARNF